MKAQKSLVPPLFEIENLSREYSLHSSYFASKKEKVLALDAAQFTVPGQSIFGVVGKSGSGKSTLMRLLVGLERPSAGAIYFNEPETGNKAAVHRMESSALREYQARVKIVFQDPARSLNHRLPVRSILLDSLRYSPEFKRHCREQGLRNWKQQRNHALERIYHNLEAVGLEKRVLERYPTEFSGGQRQRIAITRALIHEPAVLICDEVSSSLDAETRKTIANLLIELKEERKITLLFISHDLALVSYLCDNILVLKSGKTVDYLSIEELMKGSISEDTRELLNALPSKLIHK